MKFQLRSPVSILHRHVLSQALFTFVLCLFASIALFLLFDFLERLSLFVKEDSSFIQASQYFLFKIPLIVHLTTPIALLISVLFSVGRLSQNSEITAMRSCGASLVWIMSPLLVMGLLASLLMFAMGETIVPWATERVEDIYHLEIKKKAEKGVLSRDNIWYRVGDTFYNIGLYDSRTARLENISLFELDKQFTLQRRIDAQDAIWQGPELGWMMQNVHEFALNAQGAVAAASYDRLPLVIQEQPADFFGMRRAAETMGYFELSRYIQKLEKEGVDVTRYIVDREAKIAFSLVNIILVIIAFPFSVRHAREGSFTKSFVAGIAIGFGYYIVHAFSLSLGSAEFIHPTLAAWTANVFSLSIGGFLLLKAELR